MRVFVVFSLVCELLFLAFGAVLPVAAHTGLIGNSYDLQDQQAGNVYTFKQFGFQDQLMISPFGSTALSFNLPPSWQIGEGTEVLLRYNHSLGSTASAGTSATNWVGGTVFVYYNGILIDTIFLSEQGEFTRSILIPAEALKSAVPNETQSISILFDASSMCDFPNTQSVLSILSTSEIRFSYFVVPPPLDLSKYPSPIYQERVFGPVGVSIVIPDNPSAADLESALSVVTSLGAISGGELKYAFSTLSSLPVESRTTQNLILIGNPSKFPILQDIVFPYPVTGGRFSVSNANEDDGIIQLARSPWNELNVILLVSGNTDAAVVKAGRALATGMLVPSVRPDVSLVRDVNPVAEPEIKEDRTFADMGYTNLTISGVAEQFSFINFFVSAEQALSSDAYIDLVTVHSDLLDYDTSGMTFLLNDEIVGSLKYDKEADQITTTRVKLLPSALRRGKNQLTIIADLGIITDCESQNLERAWVTVSSSSLFHLPKTAQTFALGKRANLLEYPINLMSAEDLGDLAFILPQNDPVAWLQAAKVAYFLGSRSSTTFVDFRALFANDVAEEILKERSLLLFGLSSTLPLVSQLNEALPAPFAPGSDEAQQPSMLVDYRLLPGVNVGYLQILESPWNPEMIILAVMGNSELGIPMAADALTNETLLAKLNGNFAVVYGTQILTTDTRLGQASQGLIGSLPVSVTAVPTDSGQTPFQTSEIQGRPTWIMPAFLVITVIIVILAGFRLLKGLVRQKQENKPADDDEPKSP